MTTTATAYAMDGSIRDAYERNGFVFPLPIIDAAEAHALRQDLESAEADL